MVFLTTLVACDSGPDAVLRSADDALQEGSYAEVLEEVAVGLATVDDPKRIMRLKLLELEALARMADPQAKTLLESLAKANPAAIGPSHYLATADQLKAAGETAVSVEVLNLGDIRFPDDPAIDRMIAQAGTTGDPAALEKLRSLGYVE